MFNSMRDPRIAHICNAVFNFHCYFATGNCCCDSRNGNRQCKRSTIFFLCRRFSHPRARADVQPQPVVHVSNRGPVRDGWPHSSGRRYSVDDTVQGKVAPAPGSGSSGIHHTHCHCSGRCGQVTSQHFCVLLSKTGG